ncbi:hypothetical protein PFISCL1PPCAC_12471, partial [Pristionchus fissidentatus]
FGNKDNFRGWSHLSLDLDSLCWKRCYEDDRGDDVPAFPYCNYFTACDELYKIGSTPSAPALCLYRFDDTTNQWIKIHQSRPSGNRLKVSEMSITVSGSRVYMIGSIEACEDFGCYLREVTVFELKPTLVDHSMAVLLRNETNREVAKRMLPKQITYGLMRD